MWFECRLLIAIFTSRQKNSISDYFSLIKLSHPNSHLWHWCIFYYRLEFVLTTLSSRCAQFPPDVIHPALIPIPLFKLIPSTSEFPSLAPLLCNLSFIFPATALELSFVTINFNFQSYQHLSIISCISYLATTPQNSVPPHIRISSFLSSNNPTLT